MSCQAIDRETKSCKPLGGFINADASLRLVIFYVGRRPPHQREIPPPLRFDLSTAVQPDPHGLDQTEGKMPSFRHDRSSRRVIKSCCRREFFVSSPESKHRKRTTAPKVIPIGSGVLCSTSAADSNADRVNHDAGINKPMC